MDRPGDAVQVGPAGSNSIEIAGTSTGSRPRPRSAATSAPRLARGSGDEHRGSARPPSPGRREHLGREVQRQPPPVPAGPAPVRNDGRRPVRGRVSDEEVERAAVDRGQRTDRRPTAAARRLEERTLGLDRGPRSDVVDRRGQAEHPRVVAADLDRDRTLTRRGRHELGLEPLRDPPAEPEPVEARTGQDERVGLPVVEPSQARVDVAVERVHDQVGPSGEDEPGAPRAVGADPRPRPRSARECSVASARTTSASRGSARGRYAAIRSRSSCSIGTSLALWTATSTRPSSSARSIAATKAPSPQAVSGARRSPSVSMITTRLRRPSRSSASTDESRLREGERAAA